VSSFFYRKAKIGGFCWPRGQVYEEIWEKVNEVITYGGLADISYLPELILAGCTASFCGAVQQG